MIGDVIGNFRLVERLGRGGMGEVYRAEHRELQTPVAVKLLNDDISEDRDHVQRFFNEARIVSKIKHAGTVKIFDSGFHKAQAYLIMELLEGESLARRLDRGPLPPAQVLDISRQIASVLDATHRQGVIHRDLKPDNIYLVHDDERASGERVKILDFGIAKLSGGTMASPKTSGTMGTPAYMAPEQWSDSSQVDWRADAYSLGCVMFEMACGRPPFIAATIPEAYTKHAHTAAPSPRSFNDAVSPELDTLILRLLSKDPADRCVSMGQVTRELEAIANGTDPSKVVRESRPIRAESPRPEMSHTSPTPSLPMVQPPTMTTLGASAAEMQATRARRPALIGGIVAGVAVLGIVVFVMTRGGSKAAPEPAAEPAPAAQPAAPVAA
ncbi:MAG: serine/threonine protein kinase, partial [Deltaproteobacteria bacterium]|nr:serine/threonine protein kinase [Deltaproteobacteria bacterium]